MGSHHPSNLGDDGNNYTVAELLVSLRVGHGNAESVGIAHESRALSRRKSSRRFLLSTTDQNFRAIFVISCGQGATDRIRRDHAKAKAVTGLSVFFSVGLEIGPELCLLNVFWIYLCLWPGCVRLLYFLTSIFRMEDRGQLRPRCRSSESIERKPGLLAKPDDDDAFPVLRNKRLTVDDLRLNLVLQLFFERFLYHPEGVSLVMT